MYHHFRNDAFHDLYNLLNVRKTGKQEVVFLQPLPQTLYQLFPALICQGPPTLEVDLITLVHQRGPNYFGAAFGRSATNTLHPAPCTLHPAPCTLNPTHYTPNPQTSTLHLSTHTPDPKHQPPNSKPYRGTSLMRNRPPP